MPCVNLSRRSQWLLVVLSLLLAPAASASDLFDEMQAFLKNAFPDQSYLPIPAAGDERYRPKARWVLVDDIQKKVPAASMTKGWLFLTDGTDLSSDERVPLHETTVKLTSLDKSKLWNLALVASLQGTVQDVPLTADITAAVNKDLTIDIEVSEARVQTVPLFRASVANKLNPNPLKQFNEFLKETFPEQKVRTVLSAVRARGVKVTLAVKSDASATLKAVLEKVASVQFSAEKKDALSQELKFEDWRYIGYEARIEKGVVLVAGSGLKDESPEQRTLPIDLRISNAYANAMTPPIKK